jgi:hypothetical protein
LSQKRKEWYKSCEIYNKKANIEWLRGEQFFVM